MSLVSEIRERLTKAMKSNNVLERDILLVAGKGHEKYQEIAGRKYFFSDQELIQQYIQQHCSGYPEKESV